MDCLFVVFALPYIVQAQLCNEKRLKSIKSPIVLIGLFNIDFDSCQTTLIDQSIYKKINFMQQSLNCKFLFEEIKDMARQQFVP